MPLASKKFTDLSVDYLKNEDELINTLLDQINLSEQDNEHIKKQTAKIVTALRNIGNRESFIDQLLQEYGLSSEEGKTLMRLSEALVRTKDMHNAQALLRDKLMDGNWSEHKGNSKSFMVNRSTNGLSLCSAWIKASGGKDANNLLTKMGDSLIHTAIKQVMRYMGNHFVLGRDIVEARKNRVIYDLNTTCFSYDMLGEAAYTSEDAQKYYAAYEHGVICTAKNGPFDILEEAPSISIKLSAIHPRYEMTHADHCMDDIHQKLLKLCAIAKEANMGITIDAEECERLELSLAIIENICAEKTLDGWGGLSVVIQAYQRRALSVIDHVIALSRLYDRKLMVRLVKGAYWDSEIKRAQEMGLESYPVYTRKENTDLNYTACAQKLLAANDVIFPQFATHNAQTAITVAYMAEKYGAKYEFQRLQGMGNELHKLLTKNYGVKSRIYAPVGAHRDLLPYLVRRLLENGANSSFVNQLSNDAVDIDELTIDPMTIIKANSNHHSDNIPAPCEHLNTGRVSASGFDWTQANSISKLDKLLATPPQLTAYSIINGQDIAGSLSKRHSPNDSKTIIGEAHYANEADVDAALAMPSKWASDYSASDRAAIIRKVADNLHVHQDELMALLTWEAGKTVADSVSELREAIDFCLYYADEAEKHNDREPIGVVACISPWNFPLAIFLGQIVASLVMGNQVVAKPAEQTPLIAYKVIKIMFESGVPTDALQLIIGDGALLGNVLTSHENVHGICFTGSTKTAKIIARNLADTNRADIPYIAETGGINAMIIDSTALMEQAIRDVIASAFQSAGQRCSACRLVCIQDDVADNFITMLQGAMQNLQMGGPQHLSTDVGPVIDQAALDMIQRHVTNMESKHANVGGIPIMNNNAEGYFATPYAFEIDKISDLTQEIFGPILHIMRFKAEDYEQVIYDVNDLGFGLTMGIHTRIDARVEHVSHIAKVGNLYVNRNQIGAVVGVQPFGGEGLSGTGPKAGGPQYVKRLSKQKRYNEIEKTFEGSEYLSQEDEAFLSSVLMNGAAHNLNLLQKIEKHYADHDPNICKIYNEAYDKTRPLFIDEIAMPGPTGEENKYKLHARGNILCMGGGNKMNIHRQIALALALDNHVTIISSSEQLDHMLDNDGYLSVTAIACDGKNRMKTAAKIARLDGPIIPILSAYDDPERYAIERCVTIDTTAAGGNASLLAAG